MYSSYVILLPHLPLELEPPHGCRSLIHSLPGPGNTSRIGSYQLPQAFHQAWYDETSLNGEPEMEIQNI